MKTNLFTRRKIYVFMVILLLGVALFLFFQRKNISTGDDHARRMNDLFHESRPVLMETVAFDQGERSGTYPGTVKSARQAVLSFRVSGPLVKVLVKPGDCVDKDSLLMEIDQRDFKDTIRVLQAQIEGAEAVRENARKDLERSGPLLEEHVIAQAAYDAAKSRYEGTAATVKNLQAQLRIARHHLEDSVLRAPFGGVVSTVDVENHEMVPQGKPVMSLLSVEELEIAVHIPENDIARQSLGGDEKTLVQFASLPGQQFSAALKEWSSAPDPATGTYKVTFTFPAPSGEVRILPGMTGELLWSTPDQGQGNLSVLLSAVVAGPEGSSGVWVYHEDTFRATLKAVTLGKLKGRDRIGIVKGLQPGDMVVVAGAPFVTSDMKLRPMEKEE